MREARENASAPIKPEIDAQRLWEKYEDIAMHFNDLLIRLRTQSLAGVAAVSAVAGIFSKEGISDLSLDWHITRAILVALIGFWIAIWCLDMGYYNRLLGGAVNAIIELEKTTSRQTEFDSEIKMSRDIEAQFRKTWWNHNKRSYDGVVAFYAIVLAVLFVGVLFTSAHMR